MTTTVTVRTEKSLSDELSAIANVEGRSKSKQIEIVLKEYVARWKKEHKQN